MRGSWAKTLTSVFNSVTKKAPRWIDPRFSGDCSRLFSSEAAGGATIRSSVSAQQPVAERSMAL
jgi:hypothetical protein